MSKQVITDWTYDHLVKQYADFLVICIHAICFYRRLYDRKFFRLARTYGCPVQKCVHPVLADYINGVVSAIAEELRKGVVSRVCVLILDSQEAALERFVFDVHSLPIVPPEDLFLPIRNTEYQPGQLDAQFRAAIMKLALVETRLGALPDDCTFAVQIELRHGDGKAARRASEAWVVAAAAAADGQDDKEGRGSGRGKTTVPLRRIAFGPLKLDSWVEETAKKLKLPVGDSRSGSGRTDLSF